MRDDDASAGRGRQRRARIGGRSCGVLVAEDIPRSGTLVAYTLAKVANGLARGEAVEPASVIVRDYVGSTTARAHDVGVVARRGYRARRVLHWDDVE